MEEVSRHRPRLARARRQRRCAAQRRSPGHHRRPSTHYWYQATSLWGAPAAVDEFCWMYCVLAEDRLHTMRCMSRAAHPLRMHDISHRRAVRSTRCKRAKQGAGAASRAPCRPRPMQRPGALPRAPGGRRWPGGAPEEVGADDGRGGDDLAAVALPEGVQVQREHLLRRAGRAEPRHPLLHLRAGSAKCVPVLGPWRRAAWLPGRAAPEADACLLKRQGRRGACQGGTAAHPHWQALEHRVPGRLERPPGVRGRPALRDAQLR